MLHVLDRIVDGGMRRNTFEVPHLKNSGAQGDGDDLSSWSGRAAGISGDQMIELGLMAQTAENDLAGQACIARARSRRSAQAGGCMEACAAA